MKFEVEIFSRETIKPSSPTPQHLKNYQLSFIDQITPSVFMPLIFFYEPNPSTTNLEKSDRLKKSLSETLTRYYPLAGRLKDNISIQCNDDGVPYSEAQVTGDFSDVIRSGSPSEFNKFLPRELDDVGDNVVLAVQLNFCDCGGAVVGLCVSHKAADALSIVMLIMNWAETARGEAEHNKKLVPIFETAKLFPPRDMSGFSASIGVTKENIVTKRFVIDNSKVTALRDKYARQDIRPSRVEALAAFIWKRFWAATGKHCLVLQTVNLRTRMDPPLSDNSFGNLYRTTFVTPPSMKPEDEDDGQCVKLVRRMRDSVKSTDGNFVTKKLQKGDEHLNFMKEKADSFSKGEIVTLTFTSLCRLPLYKADFGWGKPVWVCSAKLAFNNVVTFMDTRLGDAVEVWINVKEDDIGKLETDEEFLSYVSPNA